MLLEELYDKKYGAVAQTRIYYVNIKHYELLVATPSYHFSSLS